MKFNLTVEVSDSDITEAMQVNGLSQSEVIQKVRNNLYLGLSCIDGILHRDMGIDSTDSFVNNPASGLDWGQTWGDNYPTEENCPIDVIQHHAQACNVIVSDDVISFARSMWNEGNLTEKIK